jgi:single-strand DNA-binding protein
MNSITIAGQLGRDAVQRYLPNGEAVASFSVADSQSRDKPTVWWSCSIFGKRAESLVQYLTKGQAVTVAGTVSQREYTDKDGNKRTSMDVRVNDIALQGGRKYAEEAPRKPPSHDAVKARQFDNREQHTPSDMDFVNDSDIPF